MSVNDIRHSLINKRGHEMELKTTYTQNCLTPRNKFIFWPVGQGLFYTGSLLNGKYNFVYDCGAESFCISYLNKAIDEFTRTTPLIDFIVISHLHYDHCGGLYKLLCKSRVKKIYLPLLNNDMKFTLFILQYYKSLARVNGVDTRVYDVLEFLYSRMDSDLYGQIESANWKQDVSLFGIEPVFVNKSRDFDFIQYWEFNLLAPNKNSKYTKFFANNAPAIKNMITTEPGKQFIEDFKKLNGYRSIARALNNTSTVLIHKPLYCTNEPWCGTASLLTGDINFTQPLAKKIAQKTNCSGIRVFQIPHHGAKGNWIKSWNNGIVCASNVYVISFGYGNQYKHPHSQVIDWIAQYNKELSFATQLERYQYDIP